MAAETIAHLNKEGDRAQEQINHVISTARDGGIKDEELKEMLSLIRINPVDTAHPTECLSKYGIALHRELVSLAYEENDLKRLEKAENVIKKMIEVKSITSDGPATTREETQTGLTQFEVSWDGAKRFRRTLQGALDEHYPGFNLNDSAYVPDIATGTWRDGADADGKASSTAHVLTEGLGLSRLKVVNLILGDLEEIRKELKEEERFLLDKCSSALSPLKEKLERIDKKQLKAKTSEKIKELSEESSKLFQGAAASFVGDEFKELENKLTGESLEKVKDTHFAFLQYGLRGPRLDARHNNEIFVNIVNRVMTTENLAQFGLKYKSDLLFSQHSFNKQKNLMEQLETLLAKEPQKMELFEKLLWEATDDGSQEHEMLKRFQIIQDHPEMVNRAIIAEADKTSMHYQNLVGLPFKLNEIAQHTPLAEDDKTLETIHLISEDFSETSAGKKQKEAMKVRTASRKTPDLVAMPVMIARSDTQRNYGSGIALVQRKTVLDVVDSVLTRAGNLIRILYNGGGMATGRGGSNSADIGRIIAQRVAQYYEENDTPVTKAALAMVSRFIWTVQGRAPRILFAVPEQYANSMIGHTAEILGRQLELKRVARPGDYIYRERELSKEARKFLDETQRECTDHYYAFRHA
ncbi:MAG: phosphoenolpyruvate carboxylase, partial [Alphaproteobacteria bacterium]|nr:phosphoenolpyruvate carboxylase [Alphaproteobacteria bacterium]